MAFSINSIHRSDSQAIGNSLEQYFNDFSRTLSPLARETLVFLRQTCGDRDAHREDLKNLLEKIPHLQQDAILSLIRPLLEGTGHAEQIVILDTHIAILELLPQVFPSQTKKNSNTPALIQSLYHLVKHTPVNDRVQLHDLLKDMSKTLAKRVDICIKCERFFKHLTSFQSCANTLRLLKACTSIDLSPLSDETFANFFNNLCGDSASKLIDLILNTPKADHKLQLLQKSLPFFTVLQLPSGREAIATMLKVPPARWLSALEATKKIAHPADTFLDRIAIFSAFRERKPTSYESVVKRFNRDVNSDAIKGERRGAILEIFWLFKESGCIHTKATDYRSQRVFKYVNAIENPLVIASILEILSNSSYLGNTFNNASNPTAAFENATQIVLHLKDALEGVSDLDQKLLMCRAFNSSKLLHVIIKPFENHPRNIVARAFAYRALGTFATDQMWLPLLEGFFDQFVTYNEISVEKALQFLDHLNRGKWLSLCAEINQLGSERFFNNAPGKENLSILIAYTLIDETVRKNHPELINRLALIFNQTHTPQKILTLLSAAISYLKAFNLPSWSSVDELVGFMYFIEMLPLNISEPAEINLEHALVLLKSFKNHAAFLKDLNQNPLFCQEIKQKAPDYATLSTVLSIAYDIEYEQQLELVEHSQVQTDDPMLCEDSAEQPASAENANAMLWEAFDEPEAPSNDQNERQIQASKQQLIATWLLDRISGLAPSTVILSSNSQPVSDSKDSLIFLDLLKEGLVSYSFKGAARFLKQLQQDLEFCNQIQSNTIALFKTMHSHAAALKILDIAYSIDSDPVSQQLALLLFAIRATDPFFLQKLKIAVSQLSPESIYILLDVYGPLLFVDSASPEKKFIRLLINFANMGNFIQECSSLPHEAHKKISSSFLPFHIKHGENSYDLFYSILIKLKLIRHSNDRIILIEHFLNMAKDVDNCHVAHILFYCSSFMIQNNTNTSGFERTLQPVIDRFPNYKTDPIEARCYLFAICVDMPGEDLSNHFELIQRLANLFIHNSLHEFASMARNIANFEINVRLKFLQSITPLVQSWHEAWNAADSTPEIKRKITFEVILRVGETAQWFNKTIHLLKQEQISQSLCDTLIALFAEIDSSSLYIFYDILRKQKEPHRLEVIDKTINFLKLFNAISLPYGAQLRLLHAISCIDGNSDDILGTLQTLLANASQNQINAFFKDISLMPLKEWVLFLKMFPVDSFSRNNIAQLAQNDKPFRNMLLQHLPQVFKLPHFYNAANAAEIALWLYDILGIAQNHPHRVEAFGVKEMAKKRSLKNPYHIYRNILIAFTTPLELMQHSPSYLIGTADPLEVRWNQATLQANGQENKLLASCLPQGLSTAKFTAIFDKMETRIAALEIQRKTEVQELIATLSFHSQPPTVVRELRTNFLTCALFKDNMSRYASEIVGDAHAIVSPQLLQFALIGKRILEAGTEVVGEALLSEQEDLLVKFAVLLITCPAGQSDGMKRYFNLTFTTQERVAALHADDTDAQFSQHIHESIQSSLQEIFSKPDFIQALVDDSHEVPQLSHQTQYLEARWHRLVGLRYGDLPFDRGTATLLDKLVEIDKEKFLKTFFTFFTPQLAIEKLQQIINFKENDLLYTAFIELLTNRAILPAQGGEAWINFIQKSIRFEEDLTPIGLTEFGAVKALEALEYLILNEQEFTLSGTKRSRSEEGSLSSDAPSTSRRRLNASDS